MSRRGPGRGGGAPVSPPGAVGTDGGGRPRVDGVAAGRQRSRRGPGGGGGRSPRSGEKPSFIHASSLTTSTDVATLQRKSADKQAYPTEVSREANLMTDDHGGRRGFLLLSRRGGTNGTSVKSPLLGARPVIQGFRSGSVSVGGLQGQMALLFYFPRPCFIPLTTAQ